MAEFSKDYHDYVFREGKLIAEFEKMYQHSENVPWHQDKQEDWMDVHLTIDLLRGAGSFEEIHDLGCGLGYYLKIIHHRIGAKECKGFGYDISETACAKAKKIFPQFNFQPLDLTIKQKDISLSSDAQASAPRLFIIRGTLWYVFPQMTQVVQTIRQLMSEEDKLLVIQNFPPLEKSFIGKEVIPNYNALLKHFGASFSPIRHLWYEDTLKSANDNWFIGLFSPRGSK